MISEALQLFLVERRADEALSSMVADLSSDAQKALEKIVSEVNPSANTLREYIRLTSESAMRDSCDAGYYLSDTQIREILEQKLSRKEKQKLIRRHLESQRYPEREKLQQKAAELQRELIRKYGFEIKIPEELEGVKVEISFKAESCAEVAEWREKVEMLAADDNLNKLYDLLLGK